jgi:hypothetical protein
LALKEQVNSNVFQLCLSIGIMSVAVLAAIHLVSCGWFGLGRLNSDGWVHADPYAGRKDIGFLYWYLTSARWSIAQLNGRTDIAEQRTMAELGFTCLVGFFLAVIGKAVFTSVLTKTVLELSDLHSEGNRRRRVVNEYLERHNASAILVANVKQCLRDFQDVEKEHRNEEAVLAILPKHVQASLLCEVRSPVLMKHPLFCSIASASHAAVRHLCRAAVRPVSATRGEVVFEKGDACSRMLLVYDGSLVYGQPCSREEIVIDDECDSGAGAGAGPDRQLPPVRSAEVLEHGKWVSEASLFVLWINRGRLVAECLSYMYALEVTEFASVLGKHLDAYASVVLYAREFVRQLNLDQTPSDVLPFQVVTSSVKQHERTWYVTMQSASGLRNADFFLMGTSDPYCTCQIRGQKKSVQSDVISNSTDPIWNQTFELTSSGDPSFEFQVWDRDFFPKKDELLGRASLTSAQIVGGFFEGALKLEGKKATGFLKVRISTTPVAEV